MAVVIYIFLRYNKCMDLPKSTIFGLGKKIQNEYRKGKETL